MFTGIIERQGEITAVTPTPAGRRLALRADGFWSDLAPGASVAVDGVCLTLTDARGDVAAFDVVGETLSRTTLADATVGTRVNLEKALRADARLQGHFVLGHVDGVGRVVRIERAPAHETWWFHAPEPLQPYILPKGAVAIDGISLTIAERRGVDFAVALIPTTLRVTTLSRKLPGSPVNLEADVLVKAVVHTVRLLAGAGSATDGSGAGSSSGGGVTPDLLRRAGFAP